MINNIWQKPFKLVYVQPLDGVVIKGTGIEAIKSHYTILLPAASEAMMQ